MFNDQCCLTLPLKMFQNCCKSCAFVFLFFFSFTNSTFPSKTQIVMVEKTLALSLFLLNKRNEFIMKSGKKKKKTRIYFLFLLEYNWFELVHHEVRYHIHSAFFYFSLRSVECKQSSPLESVLRQSF